MIVTTREIRKMPTLSDRMEVREDGSFGLRKIYFIDLFCGAGGVTSGIHRARYRGRKFAKVIACVNHDPLAIASHSANHPDALHYIEKIQVLDLSEIVATVRRLRAADPDCLVFIWASLECTNFSKAKGGLPRDADSRTLAEHMFRYLAEIDPDGLWIENVEEFMSWGPLDEMGKPISKRNGEDYIKWVNDVQAYGYQFDFRILNAADFGAYTSRRRYFAQFMKPGIPISWPAATHSKAPKGGDLFERLEKWKAVKDVLDFGDEGESIFTRKKPLSEKTLERIYAGLVKYVAGGKKAFIAKSFSGKPAGKVISVDGPAGTVTTWNGQSLVNPCFLAKYYSGDPKGLIGSVDRPAGAITCIDHHSIVKAAFLSQRNTGSPEAKVFSVEGPARTLTTTAGNQELAQAWILKYNSTDKSGTHYPPSINEPSPAVTTQSRLGIVQPAFIAKYYGNGDNISSIESPAGTLTTKDRLTLVQTCWLDKNYSGIHNHQGINQPSGAVLTNDKHALITTDRAFLMHTNFDNRPSSLFAPAPTVTASRHHSYLVNPSWGGCATGTDQPSPVIIARGDKAPMYLVVTETGELGIEIYSSDSPCMVRIKEFMAAYCIVDIKMRMLKIPELLRIQGFGDGYVLKGNQGDQKRFIGNAVEVNQAKVLIEASYQGIVQSEALKTA